MINREAALQLAQEWFKNESSTAPHMPFAAVNENKIMETSFAWILPWNDRRYLAGDIRYCVSGHSPLVVLKGDGSVMWLPQLTAAERARWKSKELHGSIEHRIANLAEKLEIEIPNQAKDGEVEETGHGLAGE